MGIKQLLFLCFFAITSSLSAQSVTEHVVVKGNTLYSLSKQYGITVNALLEANPQIAGTTLSLEDVLIIPIPERRDSVLVNTADSIAIILDTARREAAFDMYKVRRGDTPEDLAQEWGFLNMASFYRLNPDARTNWKRGLRLVRPVNDIALFQASVDTVVTQPVATSDTLLVGKSDSSRTSLEVLGILPFFHIDYINETALAKRSPVAMSLRMGMEFAANLHSDSSFLINIDFIDSHNQRDSLKKALDSLNLENYDLLLGPLYSKRVQQITEFGVAGKSVNLMSKSPVIGGLGVYNTVVSEDNFYQMLRELINERDSLNTNSVPLIVTKELSKECEAFYEGFNNPNKRLLTNDDKWSSNEALAELDSALHYELIIYDNDPAFMLDVLRNLRSGLASYSLFATEYQLFNSGITNDNFTREAEVICAMSSYLSYKDSKTLLFVEAFRSHFGIEPNKYAIRGYDIADFHIQRHLYGSVPMRGVFLGFDFTQDQQNRWVEMRRFENFEWKLLR
jgi:hypothetical protein